jgi:predicted extracellular nuclease
VRRRDGRAIGVGVVVAMVAVLVVVFASSPAVAVPSPDVVISQVYGGGGNSGAPYTHDFIELYNRGDTSVDLTGLSLQYASATGTGNLGASSGQITELSGVVPPGGYLLVQEAGGPNGVPLPTPDIVDATPIPMSATGGKVALAFGTGSLGCNGSSDPCTPEQLSRIKDLVGYGSTNFFEGSGAAPAASNTTAVHRADGGAVDTDNNAADFSAGVPNPRNSGFDPPPSGCDVPVTHEIAQVQGTGDATPLAGQTVRVEGIVTGDFQASGQLGGFFVQDPTPDADPATSDGLFALGGPTDVAVGDRVRISGRAVEFAGLTELSPVTAVDVCGTGSISPTPYDLPRPAGTTFEPVEGLLLTFPETLTATEHFQLGRFGEVTASAGGRLFQPTERHEPGPDAVAAGDEAARRQLLIDDGSNVQNPPTVPFVTAGNALRIGDTATGVTGVLSFGFGLYRLQPTQPITFARTNPRPTAPDPVGGDLRVASFNTLNYFTTLRSENPNARGADTAEEFARQQAKEVAAITGLDADVVGLMEVENDDATAITSLVDALNDATAPGTYASITEPPLNDPNEFGGTFGTDAIKVALIYRTGAVTPVGPATSSGDPIFDRPALIQTFEPLDGGEQFTVVVNHFKSKSCDGATGADLDQGDGQSCFNARRVAQATTLTEVLAELAVPNALIIGDLNAYSQEDPIDVLEAAGYTGLSEQHVPDDDRYSFVFDGFSGELDHAMAHAELLDDVTGATIWHINADEPLILDYNTEFNPPGLYEPNAYRSSDHDPLVVGLDLTQPAEPPTLTGPDQATFTVGLPATVTLSATGFPTPGITASGALPEGVTFVDHGDGEATLAGTPAAETEGTYPLSITADNGVAPAAVLAFTLTVQPPLTVTTASLPAGAVGVPYSARLSAANGTPPYDWTVTDGSLPAGLSLSSDGTITGTPQGPAGTSTITVGITDAGTPQQTASKQLSITILRGPTTLTVDPVLLRRSGGLLRLTIGTVAAHLTGHGGVPLPGQLITFKAGATTVCTGTTGADGRVTCTMSPINTLLVIVHFGVTASYRGNASWLPSSGSAGLA